MDCVYLYHTWRGYGEAIVPAELARPSGLRPPPWGLVVGGIVSTQFGAALATSMFDELGPAGSSLLRLFFSAAVLLAVWRPRPAEHERSSLVLAVVFGLALGLMNLGFYEAIARIPLGVAVTVEFAGPLAVAVIGSRGRADLALAGLAAVGILLLADLDGGGTDLTGLLLAALAGVGWATYIVLGQRVSGRFAGGRGLALASAVAVLVPLGPGIAGGGADLFDPRLLLIGFAVAMMSSAIPYSFEGEALRHMSTANFGVLMSLEPAIAALAGFLALGQSLGGRDLVAIACVVAASVGVTRRAGQPNADAPVAARPEPA